MMYDFLMYDLEKYVISFLMYKSQIDKYGQKNITVKNKAISQDVIKLCGCLPKNGAGFEIAKQLIRSAGSAGANYRASARTKSTADFIYKIGIVLEESDESHYWLEIVRDAELKTCKDVDYLIKEATELTAIFSATDKTVKANNKK